MRKRGDTEGPGDPSRGWFAQGAESGEKPFVRMGERRFDRLRVKLEKGDELRGLEGKKVEEVTRAILFVREVVLEIFRASVGEEIGEGADPF